MALTIPPSLISDASGGFRSAPFRDIGSAATSVAFSESAIQATTDRTALTAGARFAAQSVRNNQGVANATKAVSMLQVAEQAVDEINTRLARMQELAADASLTELSDDRPAPNIVSDHDRAIMGAEFATLRSEIDAIARDTSFDGTALLGGLSMTFAVDGGGLAGDTISITLAAADSAGLAAGLDTADISSLSNASATLTIVDAAIGAAGNIATAIGGSQERLNFASGSLSFTASVADAERVSLMTPQVAVDFSQLTASQSLDERGIDESVEAFTLDRSLLKTFVVDPNSGFGQADDTQSNDRAGSAGSSVSEPRNVAPQASTGSPDQSQSFTVWI